MASQAQAKSPTPASTSKLRILLAEDSTIVRELFRFAIRKALSAEGIDASIVECEDGRAALDHLASGPFCLAVLDFYLPVVDGAGLLNRIRSAPEHQSLPVIVVSCGREEARDKSMAAGADIFLPKPVLSKDLVETIRGMLKKLRHS